MNIAILLAAGKGTRMKAQVSKQYMELKDKPLIIHTIEAFQKSPHIDAIILVIGENDETFFRETILTQCNPDKIHQITQGGKERQHSVYNGLMAVDSMKGIREEDTIILIHDGARPLLTSQIIQSAIQEAKIHGAAVVGVPIKETVKIVDSDGMVQNTPDRQHIWVTQTPQAFKLPLIKKAHKYAEDMGILGTDDATLVEAMGHKVKMVKGDYENIKITTPEDLLLAETLLKLREK